MLKYLPNYKVILKGTNNTTHSNVCIRMKPDTSAPSEARGFYSFAIYNGNMPISNSNKGLIIAVFDKAGKRAIDYDLNFNLYKVSKNEYPDLIYAFKLLNDNFLKIIQHEDKIYTKKQFKEGIDHE